MKPTSDCDLFGGLQIWTKDGISYRSPTDLSSIITFILQPPNETLGEMYWIYELRSERRWVFQHCGAFLDSSSLHDFFRGRDGHDVKNRHINTYFPILSEFRWVGCSNPHGSWSIHHVSPWNRQGTLTHLMPLMNHHDSPRWKTSGDRHDVQEFVSSSKVPFSYRSHFTIS